MEAAASIAGEWFARTAESYPSLAAEFIAREEDRFRNPVGHALRENLEVLAGELLGGMETESLAAALDGIVRVRAVQEFAPSRAVGFVFLLKPIVRRHGSAVDPALLDQRIDQLALMAFDTYMRCREELGELRLSEAKRALGRWGPLGDR